MMVSEVPGRTIGPGLLLDASANIERFPPGAISSAVTVTLCPSLNIGSSGGATGVAGLAAVWGGETTAVPAGASAKAGAVAGATGVEAWSLGLGTASGAGVGGAMGAGATGFGFIVVIGGGGVLSPR